MTQSIYKVGNLTIKVQGTNQPSAAALQAANERIGRYAATSAGTSAGGVINDGISEINRGRRQGTDRTARIM
ncbi:hypothetical protein [Jeotgalicoccus halotolerans]|uniref:hypothetical protein n=1 Tax=Jeotgalicoccus halotolerans TaxID=157227 RepID=UPI0011C03D1E|nr:hypothetical protein [Jeotgalicoccus halotolerans]